MQACDTKAAERHMVRWEGETSFHSSMIVFRGRSAANVIHAMPVTVVAISHDARSVILDANGSEIGGPICMIKPMTRHSVAPDRALTIAFLSPARWRPNLPGCADVSADFLSISREALLPIKNLDVEAAAIRLDDVLQPVAADKDLRLATALDLLCDKAHDMTIAEAARYVGLSPSRLRAIAQRELSVPLSKWLVWKKLELSAQSIATGRGLAESALSGGFFDQAHFANAMRRLLGAAPSEIARVRDIA